MSHHQTRPIVPLFAGPLLANIAAWGWAWTAFAGRPVLLGTAPLAWVLGLRHAVDADHIAAIGNVVRRQMPARARPMSIGVGFSLGHATAVVVASLALALTLALTGRAIAEPAWHNPVKVVAPARLTVTTKAGSGEVPLYLSADWSHKLPGIKRVVIVVHGIGRDADVSMRDAEAARAASGPDGEDTLLIVPQFLADVDTATFQLPAPVLHWGTERWAAGDPANGPAPLSSFDVFDAILQRLADPALLPNLTRIVLAGHSAGGQVVQRYAVVGHGEAAVTARGLMLRYVVANPSSYLYFSDDRPMPVDPVACPRFDRWRYGLAGAPAYVGDTTGLEVRFAARQVVYLLGTADTNPHHPSLDTSCGAEAEGPYRFARGMAYFIALQARHPGTLAQRLALVPGVGHNGGAMFGSACGLAALFDRPGCPGL